jgi:hypothetical protein
MALAALIRACGFRLRPNTKAFDLVTFVYTGSKDQHFFSGKRAYDFVAN